MDFKFPEIKKTITDLINDEEGNIPRQRLVTIGSTIMLMGIIMGFDYSSAHGSHQSHSSHTSHSSTSYHRSHTSHSSHNSHTSHNNYHSSHGSHSSHSDHASHDNTHTSHSNVNTGATHMNSSGVDLPGTAEIPVPQTPLANEFSTEIPEAAASIAVGLDVGNTQNPKLHNK